MFDEWRRAVDETSTELNLIPVLNLFVVLIPFLLLGASFLRIGVIPTSAATRSADQQREKAGRATNAVMAQLVVAPDEMRLTFCCARESSDENLDEYTRSWSIEEGELPFGELQSVLGEVKEAYPESNTVAVMPHDDLSYQRLVTILDRTRERRVETEAGAEEGEKPTYEPLFPVTIFSEYVPADEERGTANSAEGGGDGD